MLYILKFDKPLGQGKLGQASYYLGYCADNRLNQRLEEHRQGKGAAITKACVQRGIAIELVATLPKGTRQDEKRYKKWKNNRKVLAAWEMR